MNLTAFLGKRAQDLLTEFPFREHTPRRTLVRDAARPEVHYEFEDLCVDLVCDEDDQIDAIFVHPGADPRLAIVQIGSSRTEAIEVLGVPSASGPPLSHPVLGEYGGWDVFAIGEATIHLQYEAETARVALVTLKTR